MKDPVFFTECSHRLCRECYTTLLAHTVPCGQLLCPHDRTVINKARVVGDISISCVIMDLKITSRHSTDGCAWVGELRQLDAHLLNRCCFTRLEKFIQETNEKFAGERKEFLVCTERFTNPKLLRCMHTFFNRCVEQLLNHSTMEGNLV